MTPTTRWLPHQLHIAKSSCIWKQPTTTKWQSTVQQRDSSCAVSQDRSSSTAPCYGRSPIRQASDDSISRRLTVYHASVATVSLHGTYRILCPSFVIVEQWHAYCLLHAKHTSNKRRTKNVFTAFRVSGDVKRSAFTLQTEEAGRSETLLQIYQTTRYHFSEISRVVYVQP
jgi:hypothetical protein